MAKKIRESQSSHKTAEPGHRRDIRRLHGFDIHI